MAAAAPSLGCFPLKINLFLSLGEKSIRLSSISLVVFPWNKGKSFKNFCWQWWWECKRGKEEERWHLFKKPAAKQQKKEWVSETTPTQKLFAFILPNISFFVKSQMDNDNGFLEPRKFSVLLDSMLMMAES